MKTLRFPFVRIRGWAAVCFFVCLNAKGAVLFSVSPAPGSATDAINFKFQITVLTTNLPDNPAFIHDNQVTRKQQFYRAQVGPQPTP
jgi:hypothetical protein